MPSNLASSQPGRLILGESVFCVDSDAAHRRLECGLDHFLGPGFVQDQVDAASEIGLRQRGRERNGLCCSDRRRDLLIPTRE